jgi:hypothetical protein
MDQPTVQHKLALSDSHFKNTAKAFNLFSRMHKKMCTMHNFLCIYYSDLKKRNKINLLGNGTIIAFKLAEYFQLAEKIMDLSHKCTKGLFDSSDEENLSIMTGKLGLALENASIHSSLEK